MVQSQPPRMWASTHLGIIPMETLLVYSHDHDVLSHALAANYVQTNIIYRFKSAQSEMRVTTMCRSGCAKFRRTPP